MSSVGRFLTFALRYPAEMQHLCWTPAQTGEEPNLDGVPDGPEVLRLARAVADEACREAEALLEAIAPAVEVALAPLGTVARFRRNLRRIWGLKYAVRPEDGKPDYFEAGTEINGPTPQLDPWLWFRTRALTDEVGRRLSEAGVTVRRYNGLLYLPGLTLLPSEQAEGEIEVTPLLEAIRGQFAGMTPALLKGAVRAVVGAE